MDYIIGFDVGTTSTRCILIDTAGNLIASATREYDMDTPKPGWAEQHPDMWWDASVETVKEVLERSKVDAKDITAIGISGQMHGSVFLDKDGYVIDRHCFGVTRGQPLSVTAYMIPSGEKKSLSNCHTTRHLPVLRPLRYYGSGKWSLTTTKNWIRSFCPRTI